MADATEKKKLTVPEVARLWGISPNKVAAWIASGELRAINAATRRDARPYYLIDRDDLAAFEAGRSVGAPPPAPQRRRRQPPVREYV